MKKHHYLWVGLLMTVFLAKAQQPNILWITIEDTSPQFIGSYGNKDAKTPNLDKLAQDGVRLTHAFANAPVCSSARSTIITGVLNGALGTGNHRSKYPLPDSIHGFPSYLKNNGWYTSNNVKTDYSTSDGSRLIKESWHESSNNAGWWKRGEDMPFFSIFNYVESHQSRTMTHPYKWYKEMVFDLLDEKEKISENDFEMPPYFHDTSEMRKYFARVYNSISLTDKEIGELLERLKKDGLMDDTIIFFYADHGEAIPRGKSGSVGIGYKVPMIVWFPEKYKSLSPWPIGSSSDELINFDDLAPTVLSLAGIKPPSYMTGRPFMGKFRKNPKEYIFMSRNRIDESPGLVRSITDGRYMYTKVFQPQYPELEFQKYADVSDIVRRIRQDYKDGSLNTVQEDMLIPRKTSEYLYDMESDPWKLNNLAQAKDQEKRLAEMRGKLYGHILELRDVMFLPEYTIDSISHKTTPYEFRLSEKYNLKKILNQAFLCGEGDKTASILKGLKSKNPDVVYWSLMGIQSLKNLDISVVRQKIIELMDCDYPPVKILAASIAFDRMEKNKIAINELKKLLKSDNPLITLQVLQNIQYAEDGPEFFKDDLKDFIKRKKDDHDFLNCLSAAETMLFNMGEQDLYYEQMKKWIDLK